MSVRVLLADDEALVRSGLSMILQSDPAISVVAEAGDGAQAVELARVHKPDLVLMDVRMPVMDGLAATEEIGRLPDPPKVVVLTTFDVDEYVHAALQAGAMGFLLKNTPPHELARAVRTVHDGDAMLAPSVTRRLISEFSARDNSRAVQARTRIDCLTPRERDVLRLVGEGLSNGEIGTRLHMSQSTVKSHVTRLLTKLGCVNRVQIAIVAHDAGLPET
ncbi:LuxR family two component transcriptional regulator [Streptomyces sp. Amel2xB2]|uniref:response regulator n=1 Tax=Streptomyces sp. Amel2xB2 TaxID=1305829 RepID=UPI000DB9769C|nr:response regulator transcription factor [Streptomyces sp. Amel2xB2]RAJ70385.1 LuxR family two component transcriptional regulator [Streptomyces sp. Amel2xB2]